MGCAGISTWRRWSLWCIGVLALLCGLGRNGSARAASLEQPAVNSWITAADRLARDIRKLAEDSLFAGWFTADDEVRALVGQIGRAGYGALQKISVVEVPRADLAAGLATQIQPVMDSATVGRFVSMMQNRINPFLVVSMTNGQQDVSFLAASSLMIESRTYIQPLDWRDDLLLVLDYGAEYAVAVAFWLSGEHTVTGQAAFVRTECVAGLLDWFEKLCGRSVTVLTGRKLKQENL